MDIALRQMALTDVPELMGLKNAEGWNQLEFDFEFYMRQWPTGCFALEFEGRLVGSAIAVNYHDQIGWVGVVIVHPDCRRQGQATRLLRTVMDNLSGCRGIWLDATPAGQPVYEKLGFEFEYMLARYICPAAVPGPNVDISVCKPVDTADLPRLIEMDAAAFGAKREGLIEYLLKTWRAGAFKYEIDGRIAGFCVGRAGSRYRQIGPVVAESPEIAKTILNCALARFKGQPVCVDLIESQAEFKAELLDRGFAAQRPLGRMCRGKAVAAPVPQTYFAIPGGEFG